jgi:hypothetical protein
MATAIVLAVLQPRAHLGRGSVDVLKHQQEASHEAAPPAHLPLPGKRKEGRSHLLVDVPGWSQQPEHWLGRSA